MPGTLVLIAPNSPRISCGVSGFGSNVSIWLGPPPIQRRMQEVDFGLRIADCGLSAAEAKRPGMEIPKALSAPTRMKSRRVIPSQSRYSRISILNMIVTPIRAAKQRRPYGYRLMIKQKFFAIQESQQDIF